MKIWKSFSGDHSAKLKIVGEFKTSKEAKRASDLISELVNVQDKSNSFSDEIMEVFRKHKFSGFAANDAEQLDCCFDVDIAGETVIVTTDELEVQAFIKIFLNYGGKIKIISRHDYPELY